MKAPILKGAHKRLQHIFECLLGENCSHRIICCKGTWRELAYSFVEQPALWCNVITIYLSFVTPASLGIALKLEDLSTSCGIHDAILFSSCIIYPDFYLLKSVY